MSLAVTVKLTATLVAIGQEDAAVAVVVPGQVMVGGCVSLTVTVNMQLGDAPTVQVKVVVPTGKKDPDGGEQMIVPVQLPVVVGAG